ncbi:hypothetical protein DFR55_13612 [Herbinix hemicellulosilytica]|uniref:XRE family transcriptional regulator n=1 Tax=Herbinix hemicellulosilytica TaxID=1564487 RepID=A0A0H5SY32_HERHM|nr:hypothetical protein [Herbinix hemicellulosilytica]RBP56852.1 hypothetical protein DFR55_13612 [Herbinix hemicellulosilytica]CRZ35288.1 hypothetical protein HHT355_2090 [Herbinix hemicellulosilytica]
MDKRLLYELTLYLDKHKNTDIFVREAGVKYDYIKPMKNVKKDSPENIDKSESSKTDNLPFGLFRKKAASKKEEKKEESCPVLTENELENYINKEKSEDTFTTKLLRYIDRSGLTDAEIYKKAGIDRRHFSKIRCDKYYSPKKTTAIALCIALELTLEETQDLLRLAGYSLSNSDTADLVVKFFIERNIYDLKAVNEALDYFGQKLLGVVG